MPAIDLPLFSQLQRDPEAESRVYSLGRDKSPLPREKIFVARLPLSHGVEVTVVRHSLSSGGPAGLFEIACFDGAGEWMNPQTWGLRLKDTHAVTKEQADRTLQHIWSCHFYGNPNQPRSMTRSLECLILFIIACCLILFWMGLIGTN